MADGAVYIVDWETSDLIPAHRDKNHHELVYPVVSRLLERAGVRQSEVDLLVDSGSDFLDGRGLSTMTIVDALGGHLREECKVEDDGMWSLIYARMRVLAGTANLALVVSYGKSSESDPHWQSESVLDPYVGRPIGLDRLSASALQASAYIAASGVSDDAAATIAACRHQSAARSLRTPRAVSITEDEIKRQEPLIGPLRPAYMPAVGDGACALLLAEATTARRLTDRPVRIAGASSATDTFSIGDRDLLRLASLRVSADACAARAGWSATDADVLELSGATPFEEMLICQALGLAESSHADEYLAADSARRVNQSGGLLGADPVLVTGLIRTVEAAERIRKGAQRALAHSASGLAMQANAIMALEPGW